MYYQINKDENTFRTEIADANKQIAALKEKLGDHTILSDVPADAKFTDTWVPVQDNLTSESAENALSANQGRILNEKFGGLRLGKNDKGVWGYFVGDFFYPFKQGEALPEQVLNGVTFSNKNESNIVGTMPNNGAVQLSTTGSGNVTIPAGYHNGSGYVSGLGAYNSGRSQGQNDVKNSPNTYGLYNSSQYQSFNKYWQYAESSVVNSYDHTLTIPSVSGDYVDIMGRSTIEYYDSDYNREEKLDTLLYTYWNDSSYSGMEHAKLLGVDERMRLTLESQTQLAIPTWSISGYSSYDTSTRLYRASGNIIVTVRVTSYTSNTTEHVRIWYKIYK